MHWRIEKRFHRAAHERRLGPPWCPTHVYAQHPTRPTQRCATRPTAEPTRGWLFCERAPVLYHIRETHPSPISPSHGVCIYHPSLFLLYRDQVPWHPCAHRRGGASIRRLRRPHQTLTALSKESMLTSTSTQSGGRRDGERRHCPELPPRWQTSYSGGGHVPVRQGATEMIGLEAGHQQLT